MDIDARIAESEQKFNTKQAERDEFLRQAEECSTEMTKLQGEWRVLQEFKEAQSKDEPSVNVMDEKKVGALWD